MTTMAAPEAAETSSTGFRAFWTSRRVAQAARSGALLATFGASLVLLVFEIARRKALDPLLAENAMGSRARNIVLNCMGGVAVAFVLVAGAALLRWPRETTLDRVRRTALLLTPLSLASLIVPLFHVAPWEKNPLALCAAASVVVLMAEQTTARALVEVPPAVWTRLHARTAPLLARSRAAPWLARLPFALVCLGALAYGALVSVLTIRFHDRLGTAAFDLGGYDNIFFNALHGHPMRGTVAVPSGEDWSNLRVHAELSTYVFLPFYALHPSSEALLCIQAFVVGMGALPIYLFAARRLPRSVAVLLAASYLLFAPVHGGNFYDFHFQPLGSTLILWAFYLLDVRKNVLFALVFAMALGCREDVSMSFAVAGVILFASGERPLAGLVIAVVSAAYFGLIRFVVMPHFGSWWFQDMYKDLLPAGDKSLFGVVKTIVSNPLYTLGTLLTEAKLLHVLKIFLPLAFLPLRRPWLWVGFVPALLGTILTTGYHPTTDTTFQYVFYWVPFLFFGAALVLEQMRKEQGALRQAAAVVALALGTLVASYQWGMVFQRATFASAWGHIDLAPLTTDERQTLADLRELGAQVPPQASFAVTEHELAHFSNRLDVFALRDGSQHADYVLYRSGSGDSRGSSQAIATGEYRQVGMRGIFRLMKRNGAP